MTKNNAVSITFRRRLGANGALGLSPIWRQPLSLVRAKLAREGWAGCCGLAGPPKKNRLCNKRPGGRESRARISLLAYGKQADGGERREARRKTEGKKLMG